MIKLDFDWDSKAELYQSPAPGDLYGNYEAVAGEEIRGPLGQLVRYIANTPEDWRPYLSLAIRGERLSPAAIAELAASESFRTWAARRRA